MIRHRGLEFPVNRVKSERERETRDANFSVGFVKRGGVPLRDDGRKKKKKTRDIYPLDPARIYQFYIGETTHRRPSPLCLFFHWPSTLFHRFVRKDRAAGRRPVPTGSVRSSRFLLPSSSTFLFAPHSSFPPRPLVLESLSRFPFTSFDDEQSYSSAYSHEFSRRRGRRRGN